MWPRLCHARVRQRQCLPHLPRGPPPPTLVYLPSPPTTPPAPVATVTSLEPASVPRPASASSSRSPVLVAHLAPEPPCTASPEAATAPSGEAHSTLAPDLSTVLPLSLPWAVPGPAAVQLPAVFLGDGRGPPRPPSPPPPPPPLPASVSPPPSPPLHLHHRQTLVSTTVTLPSPSSLSPPLSAATPSSTVTRLCPAPALSTAAPLGGPTFSPRASAASRMGTGRSGKSRSVCTNPLLPQGSTAVVTNTRHVAQGVHDPRHACMLSARQVNVAYRDSEPQVRGPLRPAAGQRWVGPGRVAPRRRPAGGCGAR